MPGPNSPLWSADRLTRPSFLDLRTAAAARTRPIMLPVLVDLGAFLPLRLELTCSSPAALRGVTARSASQHHLSIFVMHASANNPTTLPVLLGTAQAHYFLVGRMVAEACIKSAGPHCCLCF